MLRSAIPSESRESDPRLLHARHGAIHQIASDAKDLLRYYTSTTAQVPFKKLDIIAFPDFLRVRWRTPPPSLP